MNVNKNKSSLVALLLGLSIFCTCAAFAEVSHDKDAQHLTEIAEINTEVGDAQLSFRFFEENEQDQRFKAMLESNQTLIRLTQQFRQNFKLTAPIYFHIQHTKEAQLIETEIEPTAHVVSLPYSFLYTLYQGLNAKYDQQSETINQMFAATVEFYVWSEVADIIIQNQQLEIQGNRSTARDNLASIMMLNQNAETSDYLVDAGEAYLLIHSLLSTDENEDVLDELASDQKRYKHILCLTIGFDHLNLAVDTEPDQLTQFALSKEQIDQCELNYLEIMNNWYQALRPILQEQNVLTYWLNQQTQLIKESTSSISD
jgi:hypothetical protein